MRKIYLIILLLLNGNLFGWTGREYEKYDFAGFDKLEITKQRIDIKNIDYSLLNAAIFYETNKTRVLNGKNVLKYEPLLEKTAKEHCLDMVKFNFFSHESPLKEKLKEKRSVRDRMGKAGIDTRNKVLGENLTDVFEIEYDEGRQVFPPDKDKDYFNYEYDGPPIKNHTYIGLAKAALRALMNSKEHKENLLSEKYAYLGIGSAFYEDPKTSNIPRFKIAQNFCSTPIRIKELK